VILRWKGAVEQQSREQFEQTLCARRIESIERRAKYIIIGLSGGVFILIHLRMTGRFCLEKAPGCPNLSERLILQLDDGRILKFIDPRKFGRWVLTTDPARELAKLGPEPLEKGFTVDYFSNRIKDCCRQIKPLLLDQSFVAGIGNIYADEALWMAKMHPCRNTSGLSADEVDALYAAIRTVLRQGIRNRGTSLGHGKPNFKSPNGRHGGNQRFLNVFRRTGEACPRCGALIQRLVVGQRGTHVCPVCQVKFSSLRDASRRSPRPGRTARLHNVRNAS
jgi:formamidopyrimidine-DNA glycosylase